MNLSFEHGCLDICHFESRFLSVFRSYPIVSAILNIPWQSACCGWIFDRICSPSSSVLHHGDTWSVLVLTWSLSKLASHNCWVVQIVKCCKFWLRKRWYACRLCMTDLRFPHGKKVLLQKMCMLLQTNKMPYHEMFQHIFFRFTHKVETAEIRYMWIYGSTSWFPNDCRIKKLEPFGRIHILSCTVIT